MRLALRLIFESLLIMAIAAFPLLAIYGFIKMVVMLCHS